MTPTADASTFPAAPAFLQGGGEMGSLMRDHPWGRTSLGEPHAWPNSLRTALRILLNTGHPMYIWWGPELLCFYNDAYRLSIGPERHPASLGQPAREVWAEIWPIIEPQIAQVMSGRGATWHENALVPITRGGHREDVYWTYSYSPIEDADQPSGIGGVLVVCSETTEQVLAAQKLRESETRLELALSAGHGVGTWDWDIASDRVVADARFARLYGVDPERAAAGAPIAEFFANIHPDDFPALKERIDTAMATGGLLSADYRLLQEDGSAPWVIAEGRCCLDEAGQPQRIAGVTFDITARRAAGDELRRLNADLERQVQERSSERGTTWQVSPFMLSVIGLDDGRFIRVNPAWATSLGWSADEMVGQHYSGFLHPDDLDASREGFERLTTGEPLLDFENRYRNKAGGYRWLNWVAVPEDGKLYSTARDVTASIEQAQALREAQDALRQSQKMEAVGQLTGGIAHDFNNLLAGIAGSLELMQKRLNDRGLSGFERYIGIAQASTQRAAALTQRLLAFSRRQTLDPKPIDLNRLVHGMEDLFRRSVDPNIEIVVSGAASLWLAKIDPSQLENALLNLVINARDAMPDGGRITIETANRSIDSDAAAARALAPGQYVALSVTDTGAGMAPEVIERAFDPFYTTKPLGQGTGLGLSMIHGFVRQSGGQVRIQSEVGQGTTMSLHFPRFVGELDSEDGAARSPDLEQGQGETVLVIDDEEPIRMLISDVLEEAGYKVFEAADGPEGLKVLESDRRIDLLITDVGLPGGFNGRQVADAARQTRPQLKVLFITGYAENAAVGNGRLDPGMQVITKPFAMTALAMRVREIIQS